MTTLHRRWADLQAGLRPMRQAPGGILAVAGLVGFYAGMTVVVAVLRLAGTLEATPSANLGLGPVAGPLVLMVWGLLCVGAAVLLAKGHRWGRALCLLFLGVVTIQGLWAFSRGQVGSIIGVLLAVTAIGVLVDSRSDRWVAGTDPRS